jgi:formamidopyrimidine-DNA glycosylase
MPELPEAEVVARQLRAGILGAQSVSCWLGRADIVREGLSTLPWYSGARIVGVERRGKSVVLAFRHHEEPRYLVAELGMTGLLFFRSPGEAYRKHTHFILTLDGSRERELHYWNPRRFGRLHLVDEAGLRLFTGRRFGCDPLTVSVEEFRGMLERRRGRLKSLLMRQQDIAGIGNIYANEILYRARLHPDRLAHRLSMPAMRRLHGVMQAVLLEAIEEGGSSIRDFIAPDLSRGNYVSRHLVYGKAGLPCPSGCGRMIRRLIRERSAFYCPSCQRK